MGVDRRSLRARSGTRDAPRAQPIGVSDIRGPERTHRAGGPMRIGMRVQYSGGFREAADEIGELEKAGLDLVSIAEAYSFDAVSQLGYLAAVTDRVELTSGIMQALTRTPTLTAMTAAGLDHVSDGRFTLGLGAS